MATLDGPDESFDSVKTEPNLESKDNAHVDRPQIRMTINLPDNEKTVQTTTTQSNTQSGIHNQNNSTSCQTEEPVCYNQDLDDEIRNRLNKLNGLSDLINSLEREFDKANAEFREILKCSTDRLSSIAKTLGNKSIKHGRIYLDAKLSVEQSQNDCQKACMQFEQANKDHQVAKEAIKQAEMKLKEVTSITTSSLESAAKTTTTNNKAVIQQTIAPSLDFSKLKLYNNNYSPEVDSQEPGPSRSNVTNSDEIIACDNNEAIDITSPFPTKISQSEPLDSSPNTHGFDFKEPSIDHGAAKKTTGDFHLHNKSSETCNGQRDQTISPTTNILTNAALLSEELNRGIQKLIEAEKKRGMSERHHLDEANKLMIAQDNLIRLKREHGSAIKKSQLYFEEARRFNVKLNTMKLRIDRISENIIAAKQAYAKTLSELEQFSDELHSSGLATTTVL